MHDDLKRRIFRVLLFSLPVLLFVFYVLWMPNWHDDPNGKIVIIPRGASFVTATDSLAAAGVVNNRWTFLLAGRLLGFTKSVRTGKYLFASGRSNLDILEDISVGKSRFLVPVVIPEGWRMDKIARRYGHDLGADTSRLFSIFNDKKFIQQQGINAESLEGYLMPDTYFFYWQTGEQEIVERMLGKFKKFYSDSLKEQQEKLKMSQRQILTLASIVEAESAIEFERPIIAGVYWNRLKKHMRLEADPTVQYAMGAGKRVLYKDLHTDSPYNTYRHTGLPPGPINNPGRSSIIATLFPQKHQYLYFVATGFGGHYFAKTYSEHQKNIKKYQRTRRQLRMQVPR